MNMTELKKRFARTANISPETAAYYIKILLDCIRYGLKTDKKVKLRQFGTLRLQPYNERKFKDVHTQEFKIAVAKNFIKFTASNSLVDEMNRCRYIFI